MNERLERKCGSKQKETEEETMREVWPDYLTDSRQWELKEE